jgi:hypothetical protein
VSHGVGDGVWRGQPAHRRRTDHASQRLCMIESNTNQTIESQFTYPARHRIWKREMGPSTALCMTHLGDDVAQRRKGTICPAYQQAAREHWKELGQTALPLYAVRNQVY